MLPCAILADIFLVSHILLLFCYYLQLSCKIWETRKIFHILHSALCDDNYIYISKTRYLYLYELYFCFLQIFEGSITLSLFLYIYIVHIFMYVYSLSLSIYIVKMQNICSLTCWNSVHISNIFNYYSANAYIYIYLSWKCKISAVWFVETACMLLIFLIATV